MMYFEEQNARFRLVMEELTSHRVAVFGHIRPDGDCIGSQVALTRMLRALGIDAVAVNHHEVPKNCSAFVGDTPFYLASGFDFSDCAIATTDCADMRRLGPEFAEAPRDVLLNVDHHISNTRYGVHNFIHAETSATAEILAGYMLDGDWPMDAVSAQALYIGIATDTGQFRFGSTTQQVFDISAELIRKGADPAVAAMELYEKEPISKLRLLQHFLASLKFYCDSRVCIGILDRNVWKETGASKEDTEGLVDYARSIEGVEIGILLEEREGQLKGSFRAKDPVHEVHELAREFNGGGHACAAGFNPQETMETFYPKLLNALEEHFRQYDNRKTEAIH